MQVDADANDSCDWYFVDNCRSSFNPPKSTEDYFQHNDFWCAFLKDEMLDHAHLLNIFAVVFGEPHCRERIIHFLLESFSRKKVISYHTEDKQDVQDDAVEKESCLINGEEEGEEREGGGNDEATSSFMSNRCISQVSSIRRCWHKAQEQGCRAIMTWRYPPIQNDDESHYVVFVAEPEEQSVLCIDSRGIDYAKDFHSTWKDCLNDLKHVFRYCQWRDYWYFDLQALHPFDHFCQTWSLILLSDYLQGKVTIKCESDPSKHFDRIAKFWKEIILNVEEIREELFYQIYRKTHELNGERFYDRYFSVLEEAVTQSRYSYYPHRTLYCHSGYSFIEDLVEVLDGKEIHDILIA